MADADPFDAGGADGRDHVRRRCAGARTGRVKDYPNKPIRLIVGFAAGGIADLGARLLGDHITRETGQPVVVENRTAAAGTVAALAVAKAPADGYTLGLVLSGQLVINPFVQKQMPFDVLKELLPVAALGEAPQMIAINAEVPAKTLKELVALAKAKPGVAELRLGRARFAAASLGRRVRAPGRHRHGARAVQRQRAGDRRPARRTHPAPVELDRRAASRGSMPARRGCCWSPPRTRLPYIPDVPTSAEAGIPDYLMTVWLGLVAPAGDAAADRRPPARAGAGHAQGSGDGQAHGGGRDRGDADEPARLLVVREGRIHPLAGNREGGRRRAAVAKALSPW